jgi:Arc/MetJ-type ribon-helix-helix transcriptional regulator
MSNASITVRLAPHDIKIIDKKIDEGIFTSRSDVIRYSIRHTLSEIDSNERNLEILAEIAKERKITKKDVRKALKKAHIDVYQDVYGDD